MTKRRDDNTQSCIITGDGILCTFFAFESNEIIPIPPVLHSSVYLFLSHDIHISQEISTSCRPIGAQVTYFITRDDDDDDDVRGKKSTTNP